MDMATNPMLQANIIDLLGLQQLSEDRKQQLLAQMVQVVQDRITDRLIEAMSADQRQKFDQLLNTNPEPKQLDDFFHANIPDYEQIAADEVAKFKEEMSNEVATVRQIAMTA